MEEEYLTIEDVKNILKVSRAMVYYFINDKDHPLPMFHLSKQSPRIKQSDLYKWIKEKEAESM